MAEKKSANTIQLNDKNLPTVNLNDKTDNDFLKNEFIELKREILLNTEETRRIERFCLIGVAIIFSWMVTESSKTDTIFNFQFAMFIPSILVIFGWLKCAALESTIIHIGKYIIIIEANIAQDGRGWEHFYRDNKKTRFFSPEGISSFFWPLLLLASTAGAFLLLNGTIPHEI